MLQQHRTEAETLNLWKKEVSARFGEQVSLLRTESAWYHHGWFRLWYFHQPTRYRIFIEGEFDQFVIRILAPGRRFCPLKDITDYPNRSTKEDIQEALEDLELALMEPIPFREMRP